MNTKLKVVIVGDNINFSAKELEISIRKEWAEHGLKQDEILIKRKK